MSGRERSPGGAAAAGRDAAAAAPERRFSLLPWDRFSAWLHCVCVVGFDLELGQAVEVIYPPHSKLTDKEKTNICYLSFPDSNSGKGVDAELKGFSKADAKGVGPSSKFRK